MDALQVELVVTAACSKNKMRRSSYQLKCFAFTQHIVWLDFDPRVTSVIEHVGRLGVLDDETFPKSVHHFVEVVDDILSCLSRPSFSPLQVTWGLGGEPLQSLAPALVGFGEQILSDSLFLAFSIEDIEDFD